MIILPNSIEPIPFTIVTILSIFDHVGANSCLFWKKKSSFDQLFAKGKIFCWGVYRRLTMGKYWRFRCFYRIRDHCQPVRDITIKFFYLLFGRQFCAVCHYRHYFVYFNLTSYPSLLAKYVELTKRRSFVIPEPL